MSKGQLLFSMTDGGWMEGTTLIIQNRLTGKMESVAAKHFDKSGALVGYVVVEATREVSPVEYTSDLRPPADVRANPTAVQ